MKMTEKNVAHVRSATTLFIVLSRFQSKREGRAGEIGHIRFFIPKLGWFDTCTCELPQFTTRAVKSGFDEGARVDDAG